MLHAPTHLILLDSMMMMMMMILGEAYNLWSSSLCSL